MKIIFWQNILSIHQSAFIRTVAEKNEVTLVVEEEINKERIKHGWIIPDFGNTKIIIIPNSEKVDLLLNSEGAYHVFSGINSFPLIFNVFKTAVKRKCRILIQSEPYNWIDSKAMLRAIKYKLLYLKYGHSINGILAISTAARKCYEKAGFSKTKIFDWAYFTEAVSGAENEIKENTKLKLLFIGSIDARKNVLGILPIVKKYIDKIDEFRIIGTGSMENELVNLLDKNKIIYMGSISNKDVNKYFSQADLLILPSIFDGWGAVVNEALMLGTPVLCSDTAGASDLINDDRGAVFSYRKNNFEEIYVQILNLGVVKLSKRKKIQHWANENISGFAATEYFYEILKSIEHKTNHTVAPWNRI